MDRQEHSATVRRILRSVVVCLIFSVPVIAQDNRQPVTVPQIEQLVRAGTSDEVIIELINVSGCDCDRDFFDVQVLNSAGASDAVIQAVLGSQTQPRVVPPQVTPQPAPQPAPQPTSQTPSAAQSPRSDFRHEFRRFEIGWNVASWNRQGAEFSGLGGQLQFVGYFSDSFGLAGTLSAHRDTFGGIDVDLVTYQFGPVFRAQHGSRVSTYGEVRAGGFTAEAIILNLIGERESGFSAFSGGGIDVGVTNWFYIRPIHVGYQYLHSDAIGSSHGAQVGGGVVFRFGS